MRAKTIVVAEPLAEVRARLTGIIDARHGTDYRVVAVTSSTEAGAACAEIAAGGGVVALLAAAYRLEPSGGTELAAAVRRRDPDPRCLLLAGWGQVDDPNAMRAAARADAVDPPAAYPQVEPDEGFHLIVTELLAEHAARRGPRHEVARVVGKPWSPRSHELRDLLVRHRLPAGFYPADSPDGRSLLEGAGLWTSRPRGWTCSAAGMCWTRV